MMNFFQNKDFIEVNLEVDPEMNSKEDLEIDPQLKLEYNFRKHQ